MIRIRLQNLPRFSRRHITATRAFFVVVIVVVLAITIGSIAPTHFARNSIVRITPMMTVSEAATALKEKGVIRSALMYKVYVVLLHDGKGVQAGSYLFDVPQSALRIAFRTAYGIKNIQKIKLTFIEGKTSKQLAALLGKNIPDFNAAEFFTRAKPYEGYLFPETYFVDPDVGTGEIVGMMRDQFNIAVRPLANAFATSTHSMKDIIIMASIIEEEASKSVDRRIISGILWKRLDKGMALQVDVPFFYIMDKDPSELTLKDLATTSPYNTYVHKGLPPTPISNPGLDAIEAALYPVTTPYYFYLADPQGTTHYAVTHEGHVINKQKYLQ